MSESIHSTDESSQIHTKNQYVCSVSVSNGSIRVIPLYAVRFGGLGSPHCAARPGGACAGKAIFPAGDYFCDVNKSEQPMTSGLISLTSK